MRRNIVSSACVLQDDGGVHVNPRHLRTIATGIAALTGLVLCSAAPAQAAGRQGSSKNSDAGIRISKEATAKEVGLPIYPGATPHRDDKNDSPAANLGLWGSTFGFKLVVLKMETKDSPEKVAAFYKRALGKYGRVLDCSEGTKDAKDKESSKKSNAITCEDDEPEKGGQLFKAGTKQKQHIVGIQPQGQGSVFQLIYVEARGVDEDSRAQ
jgi:hypothetical protein